jgi:uncharacterized membrane protein
LEEVDVVVAGGAVVVVVGAAVVLVVVPELGMLDVVVLGGAEVVVDAGGFVAVVLVAGVEVETVLGIPDPCAGATGFSANRAGTAATGCAAGTSPRVRAGPAQ